MRRRVECGAGTKKGTPCKAKVYVEGERCTIHGKSQQKAEVNNAKKAELVLADLGAVEPTRDPIAALELLSGESMKAVEVMRQKVALLTSVRYEGEHGEQIRGEVQVWLSLISKAESINGRIVALGLFERRLALEEAQANLYVGVFCKILEKLDVELDDRVLQIVRSEMDTIESTAVEV